ncbi:2-aminoethylphosphonate ABC transporter permease subunit [Acidimangrovimonas sediminis]|uniref:2-aminoethylphosphonate ABC transporter permease subunit n=1 Tax=Acidimangrovimonas sediminis TaxID=2056283 RepID=UPI000C807243|nr:2-aminoethylphosphonate ABC transporter permease subunit [Acidimangrovimonas sediminis]
MADATTRPLPHPHRTLRHTLRAALPGSAWVVLPLALSALVFLYPLALVLHEALTGGGAGLDTGPALRVLGAHIFRTALTNTLRIALASTLGCLVIGFALAVVLSYVPFPGRSLALRLIETFIALPTFLVTLAFTFLYGSAGIVNETLMQATGAALPPLDFLYSSWGVILAEVTVYTPFVLRPLMAAFSTLDRAQIEVAASLGARAPMIVRRILLPAALPALMAGGSLCLLLTVNEFGIVLFIGAKGVITLPLLVYSKAIQEFDYPTACVVASANLVLSVGLYALYRAMVGRMGGGHADLV